MEKKCPTLAPGLYSKHLATPEIKERCSFSQPFQLNPSHVNHFITDKVIYLSQTSYYDQHAA